MVGKFERCFAESELQRKTRAKAGEHLWFRDFKTNVALECVNKAYGTSGNIASSR